MHRRPISAQQLYASPLIMPAITYSAAVYRVTVRASGRVARWFFDSWIFYVIRLVIINLHEWKKNNVQIYLFTPDNLRQDGISIQMKKTSWLRTRLYGIHVSVEMRPTVVHSWVRILSDSRAHPRSRSGRCRSYRNNLACSKWCSVDSVERFLHINCGHSDTLSCVERTEKSQLYSVNWFLSSDVSRKPDVAPRGKLFSPRYGKRI